MQLDQARRTSIAIVGRGIGGLTAAASPSPQNRRSHQTRGSIMRIEAKLDLSDKGVAPRSIYWNERRINDQWYGV
jgi:hypothetical protein